MERAFLRAVWRDVAMLNYEVDPAVVRPLVPAGTELDLFTGRCYVTVVGLLFRDVRVGGVPVPFHTRFEQVNLRFYVRRRVDEEVRRGVVFVRELVARWAVALIARRAFGERYSALPMRHRVSDESVAYEWRLAGRWQGLRLEPQGPPSLPEPGSEREFITEHYWGYAAGRGGTVEYRVVHPPWRVRATRSALLECDVERLYGTAFVPVLAGRPRSAFLAEGSPVMVMPGRRAIGRKPA